MSETIAFEAAAAESEYQTPSPDYSESEEENKQWGNELTAIVGANADVIVRCPWMGGAEVTLGEAMRAFNWPPNLKAEDEPFLISVVEGLLANRVIETEEPENEEEPEAESEEEKPLAKETEPKEKPREQKEEKAKEPKLDKNPAVKLAEQKEVRAAEPQIREQKTVERPEPTVKAELRAEPAETPEPPMAKAPEAKFADETIAERTSPAIETSQASERPIETEPKAKPPQAAEQLSTSNISSEMAPLPEASAQEAAVGPPRPDAEPPESNIGIGPEELPELIETFVAVSEDDTVAEITPPEAAEALEAINPIQFGETESDFELPAEIIDLEEITETRILIDHLEDMAAEPAADFEMIEASEEIELDEGSALSLEERPPILYEAEELEPETPVSLEILAEEKETPAEELDERIEAGSQEAAEELQVILDKIIETPAELDDTRAEVIIEQVEQELEKLLWELADRLQIDLEPEAVDSLARRIVRLKISDDAGSLNQIRTGGVILDYGTHELIKGLLISSDTNQKAQIYASNLGSSALRLCTTSLAA